MTDPTYTDASANNTTGSDEAGARVEEVWTYAGRRELHGKRYHAWQDGTGQERYYAKASAVMIGGRYTVSVEREGKRVSMYGEPHYTGEYLDAQTRREMEALDIAATALLAAQARERNDARQ